MLCRNTWAGEANRGPMLFIFAFGLRRGFVRVRLLLSAAFLVAVCAVASPARGEGAADDDRLVFREFEPELARQLHLRIEVDDHRIAHAHIACSTQCLPGLVFFVSFPGLVDLLLEALVGLGQSGLQLFDLILLLLLFFVAHSGERVAQAHVHLGHGLEFEILLLQFSQDLILGVLVDNSGVLDLLCAISIAQCGQSLLIVRGCRREGTDHDGLARPAQGVLQQTRQLRVPVWNDGVLLRLALRPFS
mmetsp:Transcript_103128/g.298350  ORF Transcript_103128/g.298350 Transcript_103128/m.298350 type:complete len:247 (-) Transcript_103128:355-1095(-)